MSQDIEMFYIPLRHISVLQHNTLYCKDFLLGLNGKNKTWVKTPTKNILLISLGSFLELGIEIGSWPNNVNTTEYQFTLNQFVPIFSTKVCIWVYHGEPEAFKNVVRSVTHSPGATIWAAPMCRWTRCSSFWHLLQVNFYILTAAIHLSL